MQYKEFLVLSELGRKPLQTQRDLACVTGMSVGSVNHVLKEATENGWVGASKELTLDGLNALKPYKVKRAVFMAAGFGSRLLPITLNTPKALIRVKGKRIIDTLLDAVVDAGISDIYIVRGYLAEEFDQLLYKYPMIKFIENPAFNETNNISSILCASQYLKNAYVLEADLLLRNSSLISPYQFCSNYLGVPVKRTDDWCFKTENGMIKEVLVGGVNCHHMYGISYWTEEDGAKLVDHIKQVYNAPGGKERYFENVPLTYFNKSYQVRVRECKMSDIVEIDTFSELKALDSTYAV